MKIRIFENSIHHCEDDISILKSFSSETGDYINDCDLLITCNSMYQPLEELHNSVHQYFLNDKYIMSQNHGK